MVKLTNILLDVDAQTISCDFYPEDSKIPGRLTVDVETHEIKEYTLPENYKHTQNQMHKAKDRLLHYLATKEIPPKEKVVLIMWY